MGDEWSSLSSATIPFGRTYRVYGMFGMSDFAAGTDFVFGASWANAAVPMPNATIGMARVSRRGSTSRGMRGLGRGSETRARGLRSTSTGAPRACGLRLSREVRQHGPIRWLPPIPEPRASGIRSATGPLFPIDQRLQRLRRDIADTYIASGRVPQHDDAQPTLAVVQH